MNGKTYLEQAGFCQIQSHKNKKGWLCITAQNFITGHTGWTDSFAFAFAHKDKSCSPFKKRVQDPSAPYDAYDESDDTEENAKSGFLEGVGR